MKERNILRKKEEEQHIFNTIFIIHKAKIENTEEKSS